MVKFSLCWVRVGKRIHIFYYIPTCVWSAFMLVTYVGQ